MFWKLFPGDCMREQSIVGFTGQTATIHFRNRKEGDAVNCSALGQEA
jgi:hypothetical protein